MSARQQILLAAAGAGIAAPTNTAVPVISGTTQVGSTLTTTNGTWTGSPTGYSYQWRRGGTNISGATASTYLLVSADNAATITVTVTATNAAGGASSTSTGVGPITTPVTYATWDPATIAAVTLSGSNLVATNTGTTSTNQGAHIVAASGKTTGKYYFECTITTYLGGAGVGAGIGNTSSTYALLSGSYSGGDMNFVVGHTGTGVITNLGGNAGSLGAMASGDTLCVAVDVTNGKIWFRKGAAGSWNGTGGDPTDSVGGGGQATPAGTLIPFVTFGSGLAGAAGVANNVITANFGASAFVGAVPSGYTSGWPA
jgi:hypothetical protein